MQVDCQRYLDLAEATGKLVTFDIEATGLKGDYNSILCVSLKPYGKKPYTFAVDKPGHDKKVVKAVAEELRKYDIWMTYYGKGFDVPMINTRLLRWGELPLEKRHHIDMYYALKSKLLTARKSQAHILDWLGTPQRKMSVSASVWSEIIADPATHMPQMIKRCESDCAGLEAMYARTRHLIADITR